MARMHKRKMAITRNKAQKFIKKKNKNWSLKPYKPKKGMKP